MIQFITTLIVVTALGGAAVAVIIVVVRSVVSLGISLSSKADADVVLGKACKYCGHKLGEEGKCAYCGAVRQ